MRLLGLLLILGIGFNSIAQEITGQVTNLEGQGISGVNVYSLPDSLGTFSNNRGEFRLIVPEGQTDLVFSHIGYVIEVLPIGEIDFGTALSVSLVERDELLDELNLTYNREIIGINAVSIEPESIRNSPAPFNDISRMLASLPSVASNNELSTSYSVRGGNYDENLVLVNGIPLYRPFLVRAGRQEGLSFINPDLIDQVEFSAGGWSPQFGDKMSSVLATRYKNPESFGGSAMISLLGARAHLEGTIGDGKVSYLAGVRHKRPAYLLNTLDVTGQYNPRFTDAQTYWDIQLAQNTRLGLLVAYAANRYAVTPEAGETSFGTFQQELRLNVAFDGQEQMNYNSYQGALKLDHTFSSRFTGSLLASFSGSREQENIDLEGGYRLCDVDKNLNSDTFDQCVSIRGIGTLYNYSRNRLEAAVIDVQTQFQYEISTSQNIKAGLEYSSQQIDDVLNEYRFSDSADYVTVERVAYAQNETASNIFSGFIQHEVVWPNITLLYGMRANYNSFNEDLLLSPRAQFVLAPKTRRISWRVGTGLYQQQPFYREYRDLDGNVLQDVKGQSSFHFTTGVDYTFDWWHRPFTFSTEAYYKYLWNQVPYTLENLRIRYYPTYQAVAYATGFEARLGGEFVPGTESWFSFGILSTRERIPSRGEDWIRRPTDQRFNVAITFEDHLPKDPSFRVNLSFVYGSGLPFGPPTDLDRRNSFPGDDFIRLDIGFSKIFSFKDKWLESFRIGAYVNNLLGAKNAVTYTWIKDFNNNQFAVPNNLTGRLFNVSLEAAF